MGWSGFSRADVVVIAVGGVLGASLRWVVTSAGAEPEGGWFVYAPGTSATSGYDSAEPWSTLSVNLAGCLLLGALTLLLASAPAAVRRPAAGTVPNKRWSPVAVPRRILLGAATGFCGSLTTFSTFAVEVAERLRGRPAAFAETNINPVIFDPAISDALLYVTLSLAGGAVAFLIGRRVAKQVTTATYGAPRQPPTQS